MAAEGTGRRRVGGTVVKAIATMWRASSGGVAQLGAAAPGAARRTGVRRTLVRAPTQPRTGVRVNPDRAGVLRTGVCQCPGGWVQSIHERMFAARPPSPQEPRMTETQLTARQRQILDIIDGSMRERGYPPSVREIGEKV